MIEIGNRCSFVDDDKWKRGLMGSKSTAQASLYEFLWSSSCLL